MAVIEVSDLPGRRSTRNAQVAGRQYQRTFKVLTDNANTGPCAVLDAVGLKYGDVWSCRGDVDRKAFLTELEAEEDSIDGKQWKVTASYSWFDWNTQGGGEDPTLAPIEVSWGFRSFETPLVVDQDGAPVVNTAGQCFDPPIMVDLPRPVLSIQRNEPLGTWNPALAFDYRAAINTDTFAMADPLQAKVLQISAKRTFNAFIGYYMQCSYEFEFAPEGYRKEIYSMGYWQLVSGSLKQCMVQGAPAQNPAFLDATGKQLLPAAAPYVLEFKAYEELPFAIFNFDQDILNGLK